MDLDRMLIVDAFFFLFKRALGRTLTLDYSRWIIEGFLGRGVSDE